MGYDNNKSALIIYTHKRLVAMIHAMINLNGSYCETLQKWNATPNPVEKKGKKKQS